MLEKMAREIRENGDNIFELVCVRDGVWETETLRPTAPCQNCYSLTKNFTATAIGMLQDSGLLTVEDFILSLFRRRGSGRVRRQAGTGKNPASTHPYHGQ